MTQQLLLDLSPFQLFAPCPPMLSEALGYTGQVFGHPLNARYVGFYWERSGDEANYDDGRCAGTGEYTGFLAFVQHPSVAVHLRHCDFGSSETLPRHILLLDREQQRLYAPPVRVAQHFLQQQWSSPSQTTDKQPGVETIVQEVTAADLIAALNSATWQEVPLPGDIDTQVIAAMQRQASHVHDLVTWLDQQQPILSPERRKEYEPDAPAMLLRHVSATTGFALAGELVHIHEVHQTSDLVVVTFYRDNGVDGPDTAHLFSISGSWIDIGKTLEPLLEPGTLDDLLDSEASLEPVFGRYAAWNGQAFPIVPMLESLAIRVSLPCARCRRNATTAFARSGLHRGAFCYIYDVSGSYQANLRDQEYVCSHCQKQHIQTTLSESESTPDEE